MWKGHASPAQLPPDPVSRRITAPLLVLALLGSFACGTDEPPAPVPSEALDATLIVHPPEEGRRRAVLQLVASGGVPEAEVAIEIPEPCRTVAGARRRTFESLESGKTYQTFVIFECEAGATGDVSATLTGADSEGRPIERSLTTAF